MTPSLFYSTTVPLIHEDTIVVAATHPNFKEANPKLDGWFVLNFYAFNFSLKGLGGHQTWLTAADLQKLVDSYGPYLHGNPYQDRKECLSQKLLQDHELTPVTVVKSKQMIDSFLEQAKNGSELAKKTGGNLLLLVFCHGLPNFDLLLDCRNSSKSLSMTRLKGVLDLGVKVTLVTTACYSGGWAVSPDFNHTFMSASSGIDGDTIKHME